MQDPKTIRSPLFVTTRWTRVLAARGESPDARAALSELCDTYYEPVCRFLRLEGRPDDAARELAHEFFARILGGPAFDRAAPERGRFRSFLLGALRHFLADRRDHERALRRGGQSIHTPLPVAGEDDPSKPEPADSTATLTDRQFDREWALTLVTHAATALEAEFVADGKQSVFEVLKPWLTGDSAALSQAEAGAKLGLRESAVKVAIHRLRKRFRERVRAAIADTVPDDADVDQELRYLVEVLAERAAG
jgi:DNA-directed RNA polymerase specialized sigma24 family protein